MYRKGGTFAVIIPSDGMINIKESFGALARLSLSFDSYRGVYLNSSDITSMVEQVNQANLAGGGIPVKLEHSGISLGRVVSAWENRGTLECVLEINERVLEGSIGAEFVRAGICKDLSLGYTVEMEQSKTTGKIQSRRKKLNEVSLVVKGARQKCKVHGISTKIGGMYDN